MPEPTSTAAFDGAPRLIDVGDGHRIAVEIRGQGPTVVLEGSGPGYGIDMWGDLPARLAEFATVVVYDRLGVGYSEAWAPAPPTPVEHANNLARLLAKLPVAQPVLLVGWSMGGMMAQNFAARYPQKVAGLLLLDPTILVQDQYARMPLLSRLILPRLSVFLGRRMARRIEAWGGRDTPGKAEFAAKLAGGFGPRMEKRISSRLIEALTTRADVQIALAKLAQNMFRSTADVARAIAERGLPDVPTTLVLSGHVPAKTPKSYLATLMRLQADQAAIAAAKGFELHRLRDVSHQIPMEAPEECVLAVRGLLARIGKLKVNPPAGPRSAGAA